MSNSGFDKNFYKILKINKSATSLEIKDAFKKLAKEHHPDHGGDTQKFKEVLEAYQILSDHASRKSYDWYYESHYNFSDEEYRDNKEQKTYKSQEPDISDNKRRIDKNLKNIIWAMVIGIFFVIIASISNLDSQDKITTTNFSSTKTESNIVWLGSEAVTIKNNSFSMNWFILGDTITSNKVVTQFDYLSSAPSSLSGQFIIVVLSDKNSGNSYTSSTVKNIKIVDENGREFFPYYLNPEIIGIRDENGKVVKVNKTFLGAAPGLVDKTAYVFEVPKDIKAISLGFSME